MITKPANKCGKKCADEGKKKEVECEDFPDQQDCQWEWSAWGHCPKLCLKDGEAIPVQKRTRRIIKSPSTCPDSVKCPKDMSRKSISPMCPPQK